MAEDIIDFGPTGAPPRTALSSWKPGKLAGNTALWLAVAGFVLAAVSLVVPWQKVSFAAGSDILGTGARNETNLTIDQTGAYGYVFVIGILGLFAVTAVALFAPTHARRIAGVAGLGLSLGMTLLVAVLIYKLSQTSPFFSPFSQLTSQMKFALSWGPLAGLGGIVAIGLSLLATHPVELLHAAEEPVNSDIELEVSVEPA
jgi:hypothetical protein